MLRLGRRMLNCDSQWRINDVLTSNISATSPLSLIHILKVGEGEIVTALDADMTDAAASAAASAAAAADTAAETPVRRRRAKAVVKIDEPSDDAAGKAAGDSSAQPAVKRSVRRPRRKKEEAETKELFAFYEQSLF